MLKSKARIDGISQRKPLYLLPSIVFHCSRTDSSMFMRHSSAGTLELLLYVDDIIVTVTQSSVITRFIRSLWNKFDMKDLDDLHYFLGMEAFHLSTGLQLTHAHIMHNEST